MGNVRVSYTWDIVNNGLKIIEENGYYPYGLKHSGYNGDLAGHKAVANETKVEVREIPSDGSGTVETSLNQTRFNHREWQGELGLNVTDMDFRQYNNAIGRFVCTDPITHYDQSPYHFGNGNPMYFADPSGLDGRGAGGIYTNAYGVSNSPGYNGYNSIMSVHGASAYGFTSVVDEMGMGMNYSTSNPGEIAAIGNYLGLWNVSKIYHEGSVTYNGNDTTLDTINLGYWEKIGGYFGRTDTFKVGDEYILFSSGLGDEISRIDYAGHISGKEGKLITVDNSYTNKSYDGSSITLGLLTLGFGTDVSVSAGLGLFGTEAHLGLGIGNGLGQISYGYSHSSDGTIKGSDTTVKVGVGTVAAAAFIYLTGGFGILAF